MKIQQNMNKVISGLLVALFLFGCATYKNARKYYNNHPESFARDCAGTYKQVDSIGKSIIDYIPGNNVDYAGQLDSLFKKSKELSEQSRKDSAKASTVSQDCLSIVLPYKDMIERLNAKIGHLNANYKKPVPDTVKIETPTFRMAPSTVAKMASDRYTIDSMFAKLIELRTDRDKFIKECDEMEKKANRRGLIIAGVVSLIGIGTLLKLKRII